MRARPHDHIRTYRSGKRTRVNPHIHKRSAIKKSARKYGVYGPNDKIVAAFEKEKDAEDYTKRLPIAAGFDVKPVTPREAIVPLTQAQQIEKDEEFWASVSENPSYPEDIREKAKQTLTNIEQHEREEKQRAKEEAKRFAEIFKRKCVKSRRHMAKWESEAERDALIRDLEHHEKTTKPEFWKPRFKEEGISNPDEIERKSHDQAQHQKTVLETETQILTNLELLPRGTTLDIMRGKNVDFKKKLKPYEEE